MQRMAVGRWSVRLEKKRMPDQWEPIASAPRDWAPTAFRMRRPAWRRPIRKESTSRAAGALRRWCGWIRPWGWSSTLGWLADDKAGKCDGGVAAGRARCPSTSRRNRPSNSGATFAWDSAAEPSSSSRGPGRPHRPRRPSSLSRRCRWRRTIRCWAIAAAVPGRRCAAGIRHPSDFYLVKLDVVAVAAAAVASYSSSCWHGNVESIPNHQCSNPQWLSIRRVAADCY